MSVDLLGLHAGAGGAVQEPGSDSGSYPAAAGAVGPAGIERGASGGDGAAKGDKADAAQGENAPPAGLPGAREGAPSPALAPAAVQGSEARGGRDLPSDEASPDAMPHAAGPGST